MRLHSAAFGLLLLLASTAWVGAAPQIGDDAPDFSLPTVDERTESLSAHKGKYVVLEWINTACPFVQRQYTGGHLQKIQAEMAAKGVVWLTIASSAKGKEGYVTTEQALEWLREKQPVYTGFLFDREGKVARLFGAKSTPHVFIVSPAGKLLYSGAVDSIASADVADLPKAINYIRQGLEEAMAGRPLSKPTTRPYGCALKF
ncbi:MAG: redoxin domain-containing protein [Verrucomicrobia bacterium]|nr:redoxin domain-containing protein [Verrucomicrobiota bacterium]